MHHRDSSHLRLRPLVLALLAALPLRAWSAPPAILRPAAPAPNAVPVPAAAGWRVFGNGAAAPINTANAGGGVDQRIDQSSSRAIYHWQSFDIGASSSVRFALPDATSSALNRVQNSVAPSQIFGRLESNGQLFLINANGILFGRSARVDVGALVASTLNLSDSDFQSGLTESILSTRPSFRHDGDPAAFTDALNFVRVDTGAEIVTPSGGRVFLFAKNVQNDGSISTPGGQTALAAGGEVHLNNPSNEVLYASELNPAIPALRGLLVEVGGAAGSVSNGGSISVPRGNATLVGMAVNHSGRISATTSVSENGSVFLLARGGTQAFDDGSVRKRATVGGSLTLGIDSQISVTPDTTPGADGKARTADGNSSFTASRVELSGKTVELQAGARIAASGGVVRARAEDLPNYLPDAVANAEFGPASDRARIVIGAGASIDVAGTTNTTVSVARNFVTTELLGANDLKDAPLQKDGPLYRSKVNFDIREAAPILGDTSSYQKGVRKTADELLAAGGAIELNSTGAVFTHGDSRLDVSGGRVSFTEAVVTPTVLVAADGSRVSFNRAGKDTVYTAIEGQGSVQSDRWGQIPQFGSALSGRLEAGYVAGQAGGSLQVVGRSVVLDGSLAAATTTGSRQQLGRDALAGPGSIQIGSTSASAIVERFHIGAAAGDLGTGFWADPLAAAAPEAGRVAAAALNSSGARRIVVATNGDIALEAGADLALPDRTSLSLQSRGELRLDGSVRSAGGSVSAAALGNAGDLRLGAASRIDTAGTWVNQYLDGAAQARALAGGSVTLRSGHGLLLADGSVIDVAGGGTVGTSGAVTGTDAGAITLAANTLHQAALPPSAVHLGATLHGESLAGGGSLSLRSTQLDIVAGGPALADGAQPGALQVSTDFFTQGGFGAFDLGGSLGLTLHSGATVAPRVQSWVPTSAARNLASGAKPGAAMSLQPLADGLRKPVNLSLSSTGINTSTPTGRLVIESGAAIDADAKANITLSAGRVLDVQGSVRAPGGKVAATVASNFSAVAEEGFAGLLRVGSGAQIDVSGATVRVPDNSGLRRGQVLAGGSIALAVQGKARLSPIEVAAGARLLANGSSDTLDIDTRSTSGLITAAQSVASDGGTVSIAAREGGALLQGEITALAGARPAAAGRFSLDLQGRSRSDLPLAGDVPSFAIRVQAGTPRDTAATPGTVAVSANMLQRGFADASLSSMDRIDIAGGVRLAMPRSLELDAPVIGSGAGRGAVTLSAATQLRMGNSHNPESGGAVPQASGGAGSLSMQSGLVEWFGQQSLQGFGNVQVRAGSEMRLDGVQINGVQTGAMQVQGDVLINAPQITPTSQTRYTLDAGGGSVTITGGDLAAAPTLSANAELSIRARRIQQDGVLRAPFGHISLQASEDIALGAGSLTSVSGAGLVVPFGNTVAGSSWQYNGQRLQALVEKGIELQAPAGRVDVQAQAMVDLAGGGRVQASEFVAGPGGSRDVFAGAAGGAFAVLPGFAGYAPKDAAILAEFDAAGARASAAPGRQITLGEGGPLPAGTYTLLPARYALLPGAYLVQQAGAGAVALGFREARSSGSVLVGAQFGTRGTAYADANPVGVVLTPSAVAQRSSEVRQTSADTFFAERQGALPRDAGRLAVLGQGLALDGTLSFAVADAALARRGELDIAAQRLAVAGPDTTVAPGTVRLDAQRLNASGVQSLLLGGLRGAVGADGVRPVNVLASEVSLDNAGAPLQAADLVLAATGTVELKPGAGMVAAGPTGPADALHFSGDGAVLRVSAAADAPTTRSASTGKAGVLTVGSGAQLKGGSITAEATGSTTVADSVQLSASALTLGAQRIAVGTDAAADAASGTLALTPALAAAVAQASDLSLRGLGGIAFSGQATLGGAAQKSLTLDTGSLELARGAEVTLTAGSITLTNTSGRKDGSAALGDATLALNATSGHLTLGPGAVAVAGAKAVSMVAAGSLVLDGDTAWSSPAATTLTAASLSATDSARASLRTGSFAFAPQADPSRAAAPGLGAHLAIEATRVELGGRIDLPAGEVQVTANAAAGDRRALVLRSGGLIDVAGRDVVLGPVTAHTDGGRIDLRAQQGFLVMDRGATLDVSAAPGGGSAGQLSVAAPGGAITLGGTVLGRSAADQRGGELVLDSATPLNLAALATTLASGDSDSRLNFSGALDLRNRSGNQTLAAGTRLQAQRIAIESDAGSLSLAGQLDASAAQGGSIELSAGRNLTVAAGAHLLARGTEAGADGGRIAFASAQGTVALQAGATLDTTSADGANDGRVQLRVQRTDSGAALAPLGATLVGAGPVEVEAVKLYSSSTVDRALVRRIADDAASFAGIGGQRAADIKTALAGGNAPLLGRLRLRSGAEVRSSGDLEVVGDTALGGWNLESFDASGTRVARPGGEPMNISLRAAGDLRISASISDGFKTGGGTTARAAGSIRPGAVVLPGDSASIRLVGGADLTAAAPLRTLSAAAGGDVIIGNGSSDVLVRTVSGDIDIAAARDLKLTDAAAVVYTTGQPVDAPAGFVPPTLAGAFIRDGAVRQGLFLDGGGAIRVQAGGNVDGGSRASSQYGVDWWWRSSRNDSTTWYNRYDRFQQGFATFGGGDVKVSAGGSALNLNLSAADSGFIPSAEATAAGASVRRFGGGSVSLQAGGDVVGGFVLASGLRATVVAGGSVRRNDDGDALQLLAQDTQVEIGARNGVAVGKVFQAGLSTPVPQFQTTAPNLYLFGLAPHSSLQVASTAGDVLLAGQRPSTAAAHVSATSTDVGEDVLPDRVRILAPGGSVRAARLTQLPSGDSSLSIAARDAVELGSLTVGGSTAQAQAPTAGVHLEVNDLGSGVFDAGRTPFDRGQRGSVKIAARDGDLRLNDVLQSAKPLQMAAGRDIVLNGPVTVQHQADLELSSLVAGRDILLPTAIKQSGFDLRVLGPGDVVVSAGRDIELSQSGGIGSSGNRDNRLLPEGSARITVLAGVDLRGSDGTAALTRFFPLLGGGGVADFAPELAAQLLALQAAQPVPALGSAAAAAFKALDVQGQLAQVKALAGEPAFNTAVLAFMRQRETLPPADAAAALLAFAKLSDAERAPLAGRVLASLWASRLSPTAQQDLALALAASLGEKSNAKALAEFVSQRSGSAPATAADALRAFDALPLEQRLLFNTQQLADRLRAAGREASQRSGAERDAAYERGYAALDAVFPARASGGSLRMGTSQLKTLQGGSINVLAPRGGVDVGELVGGSKSASELGIVTADGGGIAVVAQGDIAVNQSRVFTVGEGDLLMWSSLGNIDAGRGAKTVSGAPAPVFRLNAQGVVVVDTSGSFSGSGIAVLNDASTLDLYAPRGEINAGDAGIKSAGNAFFGAVRFVGADNLAIGGVAIGAPPPVASGGATAALASLGQSATAAGNRSAPEDSEEEKERKRRRRLALILDFLGFGDAPPKP